MRRHLNLHLPNKKKAEREVGRERDCVIRPSPLLRFFFVGGRAGVLIFCEGRVQLALVSRQGRRSNDYSFQYVCRYLRPPTPPVPFFGFRDAHVTQSSAFHL